MTRDGVGVVECDARDCLEQLQTPAQMIDAIQQLVSAGAYADALVVARNAIAENPGFVRGFGRAIATVYSALDRPEFAEIALSSYEPTDAALARHAQLQALFEQQMRRSKA